MERDADMENLSRSHDIVGTKSMEKLVYFEMLNLPPVDMLGFSKDVGRIGTNECNMEAFIDKGERITEVESLVTILDMT